LFDLFLTNIVSLTPGTPIQNNVHEIWATFDFLLPNFLGSEPSFLREFAKPIVKGQSSGASAADTYQGMESLKILHQQVLPFVLRREKSQVIRELPPKIITDVPCSLSKQQYVMYQQTLKRSGMKEALDMVDDSMMGDTTCTPKIGNHVLASLLQLRLICTHPLLNTLFSSKTDRDANSRSFTRLDCSGKLSALNDLLRHAGIAEPEITAADNDESGYMIDLGENASDNGSDIDYLENDNFDIFGDNSTEQAINFSKCLVFAQFTQSLDIVERMLFEPHMPSLQYLRLDGRVPEKQRNAVVDRFNQDPNIKILLLTTKVGGLGLNLTGE
jgi:TATA-binding protein-associated factor